jgi:hypothetical protein
MGKNIHPARAHVQPGVRKDSIGRVVEGSGDGCDTAFINQDIPDGAVVGRRTVDDTSLSNEYLHFQRIAQK